jgi:hypothetical protein
MGLYSVFAHFLTTGDRDQTSLQRLFWKHSIPYHLSDLFLHLRIFFVEPE